LPQPPTHSYVANGIRRTIVAGTYTEEYYRPQYNTDGTLLGNLKFALKNEPLDLRIIHATLLAIGERELETWIRNEPTGAYSRRSWFLYEYFTGRSLNIEDAGQGNYVDALDAKKHFVAKSKNSSRHRVRNNLLGTSDLCPTVRKTRKLEEMMAKGIGEEAKLLTSRYPAEILARAVSYLYTKETRSSFAIEGETPTSDREERFLRALQAVPTFNHESKNDFLRLQGQIVDPRYAAKDWRDIQNFVGETTRNFGENVHFVCPRPQDVPRLMAGWTALADRLIASPLDPILATAVSAFSFVFIHPFEDGNGRIHRFLIHYLLTKLGFTPPGVIFPVSVAILRELYLYDKALEAFSKPIMTSINWEFTPQNELVVRNETLDLYRFFDATAQVEYLYDRVVETVRVDFKEELAFRNVFDRALAAVKSIVDMPDRQAALITRNCLQNGGHISNNQRKKLPELTEDELQQIELAVQESVRAASEI